MAEVQRVPLGGPPAGSWLPGVATAATIFLALAILKPWAPAEPSAAAPTARPTASSGPAQTERTGPRPYDPRLFGGREPDPAWELWPAGYVVQFGMAGPLKVQGRDGTSPGPGWSTAATAAPTGAPSASGAASASLPPDVVDLGPSDHLVALGINMPLEFRVERVTLWELDPGRVPIVVPIVYLPTLWESQHFIVIAPESREFPGQPAAWEPRLYRLDLTTSTMEVREITMLVRPPLD